MSISAITQQIFRQTVRQFDLQMRNNPEWVNWEKHPDHTIILLYEGKIYPLRHILAEAARLPIENISSVQARNYFALRSSWGVKIINATTYQRPAEAQQTKTVTPTKKKKNNTSGSKQELQYVADVDLYVPALLQMRIQRFKDGSHENFTSDIYKRQERDYKDSVRERLPLELGKERIGNLVATGKFDEAAKLIRKFPNNPNDNLLVKPWETNPFKDATDEALAVGFYNLLYDNDKSFIIRFQDWVNALSSDKKTCWPAATYFLMLHDPTTHIFVKYGTIGKLLKATGSKLKWQPHTNADFYQHIQRFARALLPQLNNLGARDMIDVQSFSWIVSNYE
jgi:hypothetical protein